METFLDDLAERYGDRRALLDDRVSRSFREVAQRVRSLSSHLRGLLRAPFGLESALALEDFEPSIALFSHNSAAYLEVMCAATLLGVRYSPINWHWSVDELAYVLNDAKPVVLFVDGRGADVAQAALARGAHRPVVVYLDDDQAPQRDWLSYGDLCRSVVAPEDPSLTLETFGLDAPAGSPMFYTSGTTGHPKGVRGLSSGGSSVGTYAETARATIARLGLGNSGRVLLDGPIYHSAQWLFCFIPFVCGFDVVIRDRFDPLATLQCIERERITTVHLVPTQFVRLLKVEPQVREAFDLTSLHRVYHGAAPCPIPVKEAMFDLVGDDVLWEYYGATESGIVSTISGSEWREHRGSVGKVSPPTVEIVNDEGEQQPFGTSGLVVSKPSRAFHYLGDPTKTASVMMNDGMVFVGDIGYVDEDGYLYISDRRIDMIISGGVNIYPAEIESALYEDSRVVDAAVFGVPDDEYGESVFAAVVLGSDIVESDEVKDEILSLLRVRLAGYKIPRHLEFRASLPRSLAGKLLKREIREPYWRDRNSAL